MMRPSAVLALAAVALAGCTSDRNDRIAEAIGSAVGDTVTGAAKIVTHTVSKVGDIAGIDQPEDPGEEADDRRWGLCQEHPCLYAAKCAEMFPDVFMVPNCQTERTPTPVYQVDEEPGDPEPAAGQGGPVAPFVALYSCEQQYRSCLRDHDTERCGPRYANCLQNRLDAVYESVPSIPSRKGDGPRPPAEGS